MSATLTYRPMGDVVVVDVTGMIILGEGSAILRDGIRELVFQRGVKKIILNLAETTYIDGSGIGEMVSSFTTVSNNGGSLKLLNLTKRVQDLLQISKLYTVFQTFEDEKTAVASFD